MHKKVLVCLPLNDAHRAALDELVPTIERANRWARIEGVEVTDLPAKDREYSFTVRSGE